MGNFKGYKSIIDELQNIAEKLDNSSVSEEELKKAKQLTRELYERSIILNFKAIEEEVFASKSLGNTPNNTLNVDEAESKEEQGTKQDESPVFDFTENESIQSETNDGFSFDFSDKEEKESELTQDTQTIVDASANEPIEEVEVEEVIDSSKTTITTERKTEISSDDKVISFYEKFTQVHDESILEMLGSQKIGSLKEAFGLNDKLQIINELFDGDSNEYNEAINSLDQLPSDEDARRRLSEIAAHHQWEPDHRLVEDFAKMVERRYAK
jgi:hypothetical protein